MTAEDALPAGIETLHLPFTAKPELLVEIETLLTPDRLARYRRKEPKADQNRALRLYFWNMELCEALHAPLHFAEIAIRNGVQLAMEAHFKNPDWYEEGGFRTLLSPVSSVELDKVMKKAKADHGSNASPNHAVAELSMGFWSHLLTRNFETSNVWPKQFRLAFPGKSGGIQRDSVHWRFERLRDLRNRIAHHHAIFQQDIPMLHGLMLEVISWRSPGTHWMIERLSRVHEVFGRPPP